MCHLNKHIYNGENWLEVDRIQIQNALDHMRYVMCERSPEEELQWIIHEGTVSPGFLNLEKGQGGTTSLQTVLTEEGPQDTTEGVLNVITDFYSDLYSCHDTKSKTEIMDFLDNIPSLPSLKQDYSNLISTVTGAEISDAIGSLCNGKAPGCDGLTAEFYKSFEETLVPILVAVFEAIWKDK